MKKSLLSLLSLTALMSITGCGGTESATGPAPFKPSLIASEIMLNSYSESLYVGESFSLELLITPLLASDAKIIYSSSDEDVASVSDSGVIYAKKAGTATITAKAAKKKKATDPDVKNSILIRVFENNGKISKAESTLDNIKYYQLLNKIKDPKKLKTEQIKSYYLYKNDSLFSLSRQYNNIIVDKDNGYVYFGGRDTYNRIDGGNTTRDFGIYQIVTDADYHSYIYHDGDSVSKYLPVATEFNLGTEKTRIDTVYEILDSLFTSGRDLVEYCVEDSMGGDWYDWPNLVKSFGEDPSNYEYYFTLTQHIDPSEDNLSTPTMETNLDIPAYTQYEEDDYFKVTWNKGVVKSYISCFTLTYYVNGVKHKLVIEERNTFTRDDFVIKPIEQSKYTKAEDIYDL